LVQVIAFSQPATQYCRSFFTKRCCALLSALSYALHVGTGSQYDVLPAKSNQFRNPQASLDGHDEKGSISTADPCRWVRGRNQSIDLFALEKLDKPPLIALVWYGEDALAEQCMGGFLQGDVSKEGMDCSQPHIAGASGVPTISFEMIEELTDERRIEILK
jgi:hypothetical protein